MAIELLSELIVSDPRSTQVPGAIIYTGADVGIPTGLDTSRLRIGADTQLTPFQAFELLPEQYAEGFPVPGSRLAIGAALRRYADGDGSREDAQDYLLRLAEALADPSNPTPQPNLVDDLRYGAGHLDEIATIVRKMDTALRAKAARLHEFLTHNAADQPAATRLLGYLKPFAREQWQRGRERVELDSRLSYPGIEAD